MIDGGFSMVFNLTKVWALIVHILGAVREKLVKIILLWQTSNMELSYKLWRWRQRGATYNLAANRLISRKSVFGSCEPLISVNILLGENDCPEDLYWTLSSLKKQEYNAWEATVFIPAGWNGSTLDISIPDWQDPRIHIFDYAESKKHDLYHISAESAAYDWVCWVRVGGSFLPDAFTEMISYLERDPDADLFYYDEDVMGRGEKNSHTPFFKPGWSPALLLSVNYLRSSFYRRSFILRVFDNHPGIVSEWDLALRCSNHVEQAVHIARVLFHAPGEHPKLEEKELDTQAIVGHLERLGMVDPCVTWTAGGHLRVNWKVMDHKISIIIPTKDNLNVLQKCVESIGVLAPNLEYELILIDTGSKDPRVEAYYQQIIQDPHVILLRDSASFNYSRVNNVGAAHATGDLLLFLNNDVQALEPGWIEELTRWMEYPGVRIVGPKLLFPDGTVQHAGIIMGMEGHASHIFKNVAEDYPNPFGSLEWYRNYQAVTGACLMTSRAVFEQVGGFDEGYKLVFSDVQYCLEVIRLGYQVVYTPFCKLIHHEGKSRANLIPPEDVCLGYEQFIEQVRNGDPYYHPSLSYSVRQPVFAWGFERQPEDRLDQINRYARLRLKAGTGGKGRW